MTLPDDVVHFSTHQNQPHAHYVSRFSPESKNAKSKALKSLVAALGTGVAAAGIILVAVFARSQPTSLGNEAFAEQSETVSQPIKTETLSNVPTTPRVLGAGASQAAANTSDFAVVSTASTTSLPEAAALGIENACTEGELFSIGERETSKLDNPADEFNWAEALDFVPSYSNPYLVGVHESNSFPWRTNSDNLDTELTQIVFTYAGESARASLELGWSPGKLGDKTKQVTLDGELIGSTPMRSGQLTGGWWEHMPRFVDSLPLTLEPGQHTLTIEHVASNDADAAVWDFIELNIDSCE